MKIMSWNIQNGGAINNIMGAEKPIPSNITNILDIINEETPDVLVLQEFEYQYWSQLIENGLKRQGFRNFVYYSDYLEGHTAANGVLICSRGEKPNERERPSDIWKYTFRNWCEIDISDIGLRLLAVDVPLPKKLNGATNCEREDILKIDGELYVCSQRKDFLKALKKKFFEYSSLQTPAIILGDFNLYITEDGRKSTFHQYLEQFCGILTSLVTGITFGNQQNDFIFGNEAFTQLGYKEGAPKETKFSDHNYVVVETLNN